MLKTTFTAIALLFTFLSHAQLESPSISDENASDHIFAIGIVGEEGFAYPTVLDWLESNTGLQITARCESQSLIKLTTDPTVYKSYDVLISALMNQFPNVQFYRKNFEIFNRECAGESHK